MVGHAVLGKQSALTWAAVGQQSWQHLGLAGQVDVAAVGQARALGPASRLEVDVEKADLVAPVAEAHRFL